jgi:hypothetical protein
MQQFKHFIINIHRVPLGAWAEGFMGALILLTFLSLFQYGSTAASVAAIQSNIFAAWSFLMLGTLFGCWLWLDQQQQENGDD